MQTSSLSDAEIEEILNVTAQSIARYCGLTNDPSNPDVRSEECRGIDLGRQLGLLQKWPLPQANALYSEFSAKYLPALVAKYKAYTTPCNIAVTMINVICHLPYFVRYQRTPAASDLVVLQATRMANAVDDPSERAISDTCQFFSTLLALQGTTAVPEHIKKMLIPKLNTWRRRYKGQFPGETSDRCYQSLKGTFEMIAMSKAMKGVLEQPLDQCGAQGCARRNSAGSELMRCGRCKSAVYCGATHQRQHWGEHKNVCYVATF